jgi:hypothetical protein
VNCGYEQWILNMSALTIKELTMKRSESINELAAALAKSQAVMTGAVKDSDNPFFRSKYADLASCWAAWRPAGPPNGLALMQFATAVEERLEPPIQVQSDGDRKAKTIHFVQRVSVETLLCHASGQWVSETLTVLVKDDSPQSTILGETYCRRGGMSAIIGIAPEDDDGESAANHHADAGERKTEHREPNPTCPNCGKNEHVIRGKEEFGGGWLCWRNKGGCGEKWPDRVEPKQEPPKAGDKAKADKLAAEHHMTTGDKITTTYNTALELIEEKSKSFELLEAGDRWIVKQWAKPGTPKLLTQEQYDDLNYRLCNRAIKLVHFKPDVAKAKQFLDAMHSAGRIDEEEQLIYWVSLAGVEESLTVGVVV